MIMTPMSLNLPMISRFNPFVPKMLFFRDSLQEKTFHLHLISMLH